MKIITWNVNGIRACAQKGMWSFVEAEQPDVFCIQETKAHPEQVSEDLRSPKGWQSFFSICHRKGYSGTATYLKSEPDLVKYGIGIRKFDFEGRFTVTTYKGIDIYNIYFPNGGSGEDRHMFKQDFLQRLSGHLATELEKKKEIIVLGDYNIAYLDYDVYAPQELSSVSGFLPEERQWFRDFLKMGFVDTYRLKNPERRGRYTWWSYQENGRAANRGWRIDHICVSPGLEKRVVRAEILDQVMGSDHCPVLLELKD